MCVESGMVQCMHHVRRPEMLIPERKIPTNPSFRPWFHLGWANMRLPEYRRFQSMIPFTRVPFRAHIFDPQAFRGAVPDCASVRSRFHVGSARRAWRRAAARRALQGASARPGVGAIQEARTSN